MDTAGIIGIIVGLGGFIIAILSLTQKNRNIEIEKDKMLNESKQRIYQRIDEVKLSNDGNFVRKEVFESEVKHVHSTITREFQNLNSLIAVQFDNFKSQNDDIIARLDHIEKHYNGKIKA